MNNKKIEIIKFSFNITPEDLCIVGVTKVSGGCDTGQHAGSHPDEFVNLPGSHDPIIKPDRFPIDGDSGSIPLPESDQKPSATIVLWVLVLIIRTFAI